MSTLADRLRNNNPYRYMHVVNDPALMIEAADELDRLAATLDAVQESRRGLWVEHEKLTAELAQAMADAERYRWLRKHGNAFYDCIQYRGVDEVCDAAVDAARALVGQETKL